MARQLGTLTIDLIAKIGGFIKGMTDAERVADRKARDMKRNLDKHAKDIQATWNGVGKVIGASIAGFTVAGAVSKLSSIAKEVANNAKEIERFSALANTSTETFQRLAYGANTVGVSAEKMADIFKDVQDKFGDFAQTGGGEMKDFFETIAPKVGVTIDQFRRLSGGDALQLYYSSLEKANLSQQDMVFYLEAVANDATLLQPLLQSNGRAWKDLGDEAQRVGAIMDSQLLAASKAYQEESRKLEGALQGVRNEIAAQLLPALTDLNRSLSNEGVQGGIRATAGMLGEMAVKVVELSNQFFLGMKYANGFWDALFKYGLSNPFKSNADQVSSLNNEMKELQGRAAKFSIFTMQKERENNAQEQKSIQQKLGYFREMANLDLDKDNAFLLRNYKSRAHVTPAANEGPLSPPVAPKTPKPAASKSTGKSQAEKDAEAAAKFLQNLRDQVFKSQEKTALEQMFYDIHKDNIKLSDAQLETATSLAKQLDKVKEDERQRALKIDEQNALYELQNQLLQQRAQYGIEIDTYGKGDKAAGEMRERAALLQQQNEAIRQLENERTNAIAKATTEKEIAQAQDVYARRIELTKEFQSEQLALFETHLEDRRIKESDWLAGAESAIATYMENVRNMYDQTKALATSVMGGLEDVAVNFVTNRKLDFKSLGDDLLAQITRIQTKKIMLSWMDGKEGDMINLFGQFGTLLGFSGGGYTGSGGVNDPAGVVHKGEVVWSQFDIAKAGGVGVVEAMRRGLAGYSRGGGVGLPRAVSSGMLANQAMGAGSGTGRAAHSTTFVVQGRVDRQTQNQIAQENRRQLERSSRLTA